MKKREVEGTELLAELETARKQVLQELEKEMGSRWNMSRGKVYLKRFQEFYDLISMLMSQLIKNEIRFSKIQMQLENVNEMVQKVAQKVDVDLSDLKGKVESFQKTIEMPAFAEVAEFVRALKENVKRTERAQEDYVD
jgi:hypothetical protein